jgi:AraC-like DNA-binding protein
MSDLEAIAAEFKKYKGNLSHCRYPAHLWDRVYQLANHYSLHSIASAIGVSVHYLERKFATRAKSITFASVQVAALPATIKIEFKQMTIHANESQLFSVIQALIKEI